VAGARSLTVRDNAGAPVTSGVVIQLYVDMTTLALRTAPAITHVGEGKWVFTPSDADEAAGTFCLVNCVGNLPRRATFAIHKPDGSNQFWAFHFDDGDGFLWNGANATVLQYADPTGAARTPPAFVRPASAFMGVVGIYALVPTVGDVAAGIVGRFDAPTGASPPYWEFGSVPVVAGGGDGTSPVVSAITPTPGSAITRETPISFNVTDAGGNLEHTNVCVYYPSLQRFEVLFYSAISGTWGTRPAGFGPQYTGTRTPITNGFAFSNVIRRGGWPAHPVVVIDPTDTTGNEAA
jgi:hypothetical protein